MTTGSPDDTHVRWSEPCDCPRPAEPEGRTRVGKGTGSGRLQGEGGQQDIPGQEETRAAAPRELCLPSPGCGLGHRPGLVGWAAPPGADSPVPGAASPGCRWPIRGGRSPRGREIDRIPGPQPAPACPSPEQKLCAPVGGGLGPAGQRRGEPSTRPRLGGRQIRHLYKQGHKDGSHGRTSCAPSPRRAL